MFFTALCATTMMVACQEESNSSQKEVRTEYLDVEKVVTQCNSENCNATCCNDVCRDTTTNGQHCGACNHACGEGEICVDSRCTLPSTGGCDVGEAVCDGVCKNVIDDVNNCGGCGIQCNAGEVCEYRSCEIDCGDLSRCDGRCTDLLSDNDHCGSCNTACNAGEVCINAHCSNTCSHDNEMICNDACLDVMSNPDHCGNCDTACDGSESCVSGLCTPVECRDGLVCNHECLPDAFTAEHCGSCDNACGDGQFCNAGTCDTTCPVEGQIVCDHTCLDVTNDNVHCGSCENACENNAYCQAGSCVTTCDVEGQIICNHECTDSQTDTQNCGSCGNACVNTQECREGQCVCPENDPYCDVVCENNMTLCGDGQCYNFKTDVTHCGSCDNACAEGWLCLDGQCLDVATKTLCADGNYVDTQNDASNCGACGVACPANVVCSQGSCSGCAEDYLDCDGNTENGCESTTADCECQDGDTQSCYYGPTGTEGVGACHAGIMTCTNNKWSSCVGMVVPVTNYTCMQGVTDPTKNDLNCDGKIDGTEDWDNDGYSICGGDCCDIGGQNESCPALIKNANLIHPRVTGSPLETDVDLNCDGKINAIKETCDASYTYGTNLTTQTARDAAGLQLARAMDICNMADEDGFGIVSATTQLLNTTLGNSALGSAINVFPSLGKTTPIISPKKGNAFAGISTGQFQNANLSQSKPIIASATIPEVYFKAHGNALQTVSGCQTSNNIKDAVSLKLTLKAPETATGFQFDFRFYSHEYPTYVCTNFNDFFIALLTSQAKDIPADKNIVFDKNGNPVSINNAFFTSCQPISCSSQNPCKANYTKGCVNGSCQTIYGACPDGTGDLAAFYSSGIGGATAWLTTKAPIVGGETFTLEFIIWDTGDQNLDSAAIIDGFRWITDNIKVEVGTDFSDNQPRT